MEQVNLESRLLDSCPDKIDEANHGGHQSIDTTTTTENISCFTVSLVLSTFIAVCGSFSQGIAMGYSSPAESDIMGDLGLSLAQYSVFASSLTFGGMFSAFFSGKIAALVGRKQTMWFSEIFCSIGWLAIAFAEDVWVLDAGRLSVGFGTGLISYVVPVYIAEITPKNVRGGFTFCNQLSQCCGLSFVYIMGNVVSWRILALLGAVPCFLQVIGLFFIPESPRWLAMYRREQKFETTLQRLRGKHADIHIEAADIRDIVETLQNDSNSGITNLFQRRHARPLIVGIGLMLLQQLVGSSGIISYAGSIFLAAGFSSSIGTTLLALLMVPKALLVVFIVDICGRRPLLMISTAGLCFCSFLLGLSFYLKELDYPEKLTSVLLLVGIMGYFSSFALGLGGIPWVVMSEIFPVDVKVAAGTIVTVSNWFFSWIVVYTFSFMLNWSASGTFYIFSSISFVAIVFVWALVPETKNRTLEEIQASFA